MSMQVGAIAALVGATNMPGQYHECQRQGGVYQTFLLCLVIGSDNQGLFSDVRALQTKEEAD